MTDPNVVQTSSKVFEIIACGLGSIIVFMLGWLINTVSTLRKDFNSHVLEMTRELSHKVSAVSCGEAQSRCVGLNHTIIKDPLEKEDKALWAALSRHTHKGIDDNGAVIFRDNHGGKNDS